MEAKYVVVYAILGTITSSYIYTELFGEALYKRCFVSIISGILWPLIWFMIILKELTD